MDCRYYALVFFILAGAVAAAPADTRFRRQSDEVNEITSTTTTTTPKPAPKRRPSNIFRLFTTLLSETRDDTRRAFAEIGRIFNLQFTPTPKPTVNGPISSSTEAMSDEASTTEPYRITREEFNGILQSNLRGIVRLFRLELRNAITDSNKNVREFGREFRKQLRPYVEVRNRRLS